MLCVSTLLKLPDPFQTDFSLKPDAVARRKLAFDALTFVRVMIQLVAGCNGEGYGHALMNVFNCEGERQAPTRSALCQIRKNVSWRFFAKNFYDLIHKVDPWRITLNDFAFTLSKRLVGS